MPATLNVDAVWAIAAGLGLDNISQLAERADMDRTLLSRVLAGKRPVKPSHIVALARALRCAPIAILGPEDPAEAIKELTA